jgi:hypothetical protein
MLFLVSVTLIFTAFFSALLLPEFWPAANSVGYMYYVLSIPIALLTLLILGVWGIVGMVRSRLSQRPAVRRHVLFTSAASIGFMAFCTCAGARALIGYGLPAGSCLLTFDAKVWQDPRSSEFIRDDITPRQKMLRDVVRNVIPGRTGAEVETLLGPSLDSPYFDDMGRDLIYQTGPQRDSLFAIDSEWLLIWLDHEGSVVRFRIVSD